MSLALATKIPRALCITRNPALRRTLRRTLKGAGSSVEFFDHLSEELANGAALIIIDQDCRRSSDPGVIQMVSEGGRIIILGDSLEDDEVVSLIRNLPMNHLISEFQNPDELELVVTSVKLLSGDIFGLHKYLSWGTEIREASVRSYEEKRANLQEIAEHAKAVGARRQVIARIESVADELLMNALYDAPAVSRGVSRQNVMDKVGPDQAGPDQAGPDQAGSDQAGPDRAASRSAGAEAALLRYACDGRYFAISVQDNYGELHKEAILDHLSRARAQRGRPREDDSAVGGAGLGLYFILSSVTRFIANIEKGHRTEVICLFDMKQRGRDADNCARSLHIFSK